VTNSDLNTFSDWHRNELRRLLPSDDPDLVERWIEHAEIQCQIVCGFGEVPMPSEHLKFTKVQLGRLEKGTRGLLAMWGQGNRIQYQRTLADTDEPRASELINRNDDIMNRSFQIWRELVRLKQDIESTIPSTGEPGRPKADKTGLVRELSQAFEFAGFGKPSGDKFADIVRICLDAVGLPNEDPARSLKALK
jgi:hypothetical protein